MGVVRDWHARPRTVFLARMLERTVVGWRSTVQTVGVSTAICLTASPRSQQVLRTNPPLMGAGINACPLPYPDCCGRSSHSERPA